MAEIKFIRGSSSNLNSTPKVDGQILFSKDASDNVNIYYDYLDNGTAERAMVGGGEAGRISDLEDTVNGTVSSDGLVDRVSDLEDSFIKVTGEVDGTSLVFTDNAITGDIIVDGPYIEGITMGYTSVVVNTTNHTVTYTLANSSADDAAAYILIWR